MMLAGLGSDSSIGDIAGNMLTNRFNQAQTNINNAGQMLMNPEEELKRRMGMQPVQPTVPTEQQVAQQAQPLEQQLQQYRPVAPTPIMANQPMPEIGEPPVPGKPIMVAGPAQLPSQTRQEQYTGPSQGAEGQTVGQPMMQPSVQTRTMAQPVMAQPATTAPAIAPPAPTAPTWVDAANKAGTNFTSLLDVAAKYPESRDFIQNKLESSFKNKTKEDEANQLFKDAASGDLKAQNKISLLLRPETGKPKEEVTVGDYAKAYLYKRLGLDSLAENIQKKIIGKETKFGQVTVGGTNWAVETDPTGNIIRARDEEGNYATEATLNKLRAGGQKFGSQAYGFTGESAIIPEGQTDAGQEYRQRTNAVSGAIENVITTGPNSGKLYAGPPGSARSVGTSFSKALNQAFIDYQTKPTVEMAKSMLDIAGKVDDGSGRTINAVNARIRQMTPSIFNQITSGQAGTPPAPTSAVAQPAPTPQVTTAGTARPTARPTATPPVAPTPVQQPVATGGGGGSLLAQQTQIPASIETREQIKRAELKPPAEERGKMEAKDIKNQNFADSSYSLIKPISDEIKRSTGSGIGAGVDVLAGKLGASTKGAQSIAKLEVLSYPILANVPRFEGPQSDYDVQLYRQAAGDFANASKPVATRLAALDAMITILKKYDKAGKNDWTFGSKQESSGQGTTSSGNKYKKVQ
jgi:hypothetical protein